MGCRVLFKMALKSKRTRRLIKAPKEKVGRRLLAGYVIVPMLTFVNRREGTARNVLVR